MSEGAETNSGVFEKEYKALVDEVFDKTTEGTGRVNPELADRSVSVAVKYFRRQIGLISAGMEEPGDENYDADISSLKDSVEKIRDYLAAIEDFEVRHDATKLSDAAKRVSADKADSSVSEANFWEVVGKVSPQVAYRNYQQKKSGLKLKLN